MKNVIALYAEHGLTLTVNEERLVAKCTRETKRARLGYKVEFNYRFGSAERMNEYVENFINNKIANIAEKARYAEEKKAKANELANSVVVGDIFVNSWGWEQTNVEFYQVVAKPTAKTVIVREIGQNVVEGSELNMACYVRPDFNNFVGEEVKTRIGTYGIKVEYGTARKTTADKKQYNSWYA